MKLLLTELAETDSDRSMCTRLKICLKRIFCIVETFAEFLPSMLHGAIVRTLNRRTIQSQHRCVIINAVSLF